MSFFGGSRLVMLPHVLSNRLVNHATPHVLGYRKVRINGADQVLT